MSDDIQNEFYADREDAGERSIQHSHDRLAVVQEIFQQHQFDKILDARCGNGLYTSSLADACEATEVHGFELYKNKREQANRRDINARRIDLNNARFPFKNDSFDAVVGIDIIEHLYDPDHFLEEAKRVLKSEGFLILATPNLASWHNRISLLFGYQPFAENLSRRYPIGHLFENDTLIDDEVPPSSHHFRVFTLRSLREILQHYEYDIREVNGASAVLPDGMPFHTIMSYIEQLSASFPSLSFEIVIIATPEKDD